eukprot:5607155-Amphidinium_carterae.1
MPVPLLPLESTISHSFGQFVGLREARHALHPWLVLLGGFGRSCAMRHCANGYNGSLSQRLVKLSKILAERLVQEVRKPLPPRVTNRQRRSKPPLAVSTASLLQGIDIPGERRAVRPRSERV